MKKTVAIFCGGASYEHEVSIVTGIQVADAIDASRYESFLVYFDKENKPFLVDGYKVKKDFKTKKHSPVQLHKSKKGLTLVADGLISKKITVDAVYLAFHGGMGESGLMQGMLEYFNTPFTGPTIEGSTISMNKVLTKEVLAASSISQLPWVSVTKNNLEKALQTIPKTLSFPVIIKPVHLGSSIGISLVKNEIELEQQLKLALQLDSEILVEPALTDFTEYNVSVRAAEDKLECSPVEEPVKSSDTLSFEDKYENGSKKTGGAGMESLDRILPAKISDELRGNIQDTAKAVYKAARLAGLVRIDFLYADEKLYCSEINPIPGSMSFYLWEANGEQFKEQISHSIEGAIKSHQSNIHVHPYETDIVDKYIEY